MPEDKENSPSKFIDLPIVFRVKPRDPDDSRFEDTDETKIMDSLFEEVSYSQWEIEVEYGDGTIEMIAEAWYEK
jgi:hypothetical protein